MGIYDSKLWISDLDEVIASFPELKGHENKTVMVTGCTGLICSAVVDVMIRWNETHEEKIEILADGRNERKVIERFKHYSRFRYHPRHIWNCIEPVILSVE